MSHSGESDSSSHFRRLLEAARQGSNSSLGEALDICRQYLLLVANQELDEQLKAKGGASDLVQETFFEAQRDFGRFSGKSQEELTAWLRQILLHNIQNFRRFWLETEKRKASAEVPLQADAGEEGGQEIASPQQSPSQSAMKKERIAALDRALGRLSEEQRLAIVLRNQQHLSFDEIGKQIGRSGGAARKVWARAVERLQEELSANDDSSSR